MTIALFEGDDEANTPLTPQERLDLIPTYVATRAQLNAAEQENIANADLWASRRRRRLDVLDRDELFLLHRRMLNRVWRWAGQVRTTERNIGVPPHMIEPDLHQLLGDARYWVEHESYAPDELAVRFHHRLVFIHPFPNGNGRHARLAADLLVSRLGQRRFNWGGADIAAPEATRQRYVAALRAADGHDIGPLLAFARS